VVVHSGVMHSNMTAFFNCRYETHEMQRAVKERFAAIARDISSTATDVWTVVNAAGSIEAVQQRVNDIVLPIVNSRDDKPLRTLWEGKPLA
jgi:thymidylate kinase